MRVISGFLKGRNIEGYDIVGTRPTMDRVKESVFGTIQNYIREGIVLDLFAGTGNLGIEAISNGASKCYFVDNSKEAIKCINNNINKMNIDDKCVVLNEDYINALNYFIKNGIKFDIIFIDPPYKYQIIEDIIKIVSENNLLNSNGILVLEFEFDKIGNIYDLSIIKEKKYGKKSVIVLKNVD